MEPADAVEKTRVSIQPEGKVRKPSRTNELGKAVRHHARYKRMQGTRRRKTSLLPMLYRRLQARRRHETGEAQSAPFLQLRERVRMLVCAVARSPVQNAISFPKMSAKRIIGNRSGCFLHSLDPLHRIFYFSVAAKIHML